MRPINADELKQKLLDERDKIPLELPPRPWESGMQPNHYGEAVRHGIRIALRCMEQTQTLKGEYE